MGKKKVCAVFFDFDGTLANCDMSVWRQMWLRSGHEIGEGSYYLELKHLYNKKEITYQMWCDKTCEAIKKGGFCKNDLNEIAKTVKLIDGAKETFIFLKQKGYSLHIVSGNVLEIIMSVLGKNASFFDSISANDMLFCKNGAIKRIVGTRYDYEGKAKYIEEYKTKTNSEADEIVFVGNDYNDEWAHEAGCKTICINPQNTDHGDRQKWKVCLKDVKNLAEILPYIYG